MAFGIDMGPSSQENQSYNSLYGTSSWAANQGMQDIGQSQAFMSAILSGDPTKIGQVLGPQIRAIQQQGEEKKATTAQFNNRGGGTNAALQRVGDTTRAGVNDLVSSLTGTALSGLSTMGTSLLGAGMSGFGTSFGEAKTMQDQRASKWDDLFKGIFSVAGGVAGGLPGAAGGPLDFASNFFASQS